MAPILNYLWIIIFSIHYTYAQWENVADQLLTEDISEETLENYVWLTEGGIKINEVTLQELMLIPDITPKMAAAIYFYRENYGPLLSHYELLTINGFTIEYIKRILPYLDFELPQEKPTFSLEQIRSTLLYRTGGQHPAPSGYTDSSFYGSPVHHSLRIRTQQKGVFDLGIQLEQDAGEPLRSVPGKKYYGPDFISGYISLENQLGLDNIILGNYMVGHGMGLVWGGGFFMGKQLNNLPQRHDGGSRPYNSATESGFLNGLSLRKEFRNTQLSLYGSRTRMDARQDSIGRITALSNQSGLHRTEKELSNRKNATRYLAGMAIKQHFKNKDGFVGYTNQLSSIVQEPLTFFQSFYYQYYKGPFQLSGELAMNGFQHPAFIHSINAYPIHDVRFSLTYRNYHPDFENDFARALSEGSSPQNEEGIYFQWMMEPRGLFKLSGYMDLFRFHQSQFRKIVPYSGNELAILVDLPVARYTTISAQYRMQNKEQDRSNGYGLKESILYRDHDVRVQIRNSPTYHIKMTTRIQGTYFEGNNTSFGTALAQDITWKVNQKWNATLRAARFNTDFHTRQYLYEHHVLYTFSIPAYQGNGYRSYLLLTYHPVQSVSLRFRYSLTRYDEPRIIGTGPMQREGTHYSDGTFQIFWRF